MVHISFPQDVSVCTKPLASGGWAPRPLHSCINYLRFMVHIYCNCNYHNSEHNLYILRILNNLKIYESYLCVPGCFLQESCSFSGAPCQKPNKLYNNYILQQKYLMKNNKTIKRYNIILITIAIMQKAPTSMCISIYNPMCQKLVIQLLNQN